MKAFLAGLLCAVLYVGATQSAEWPQQTRQLVYEGCVRGAQAGDAGSLRSIAMVCACVVTRAEAKIAAADLEGDPARFEEVTQGDSAYCADRWRTDPDALMRDAVASGLRLSGPPTAVLSDGVVRNALRDDCMHDGKLGAGAVLQTNCTCLAPVVFDHLQPRVRDKLRGGVWGPGDELQYVDLAAFEADAVARCPQILDLPGMREAYESQ